MATAQQVAHYQDLAVQAEAMRIAFSAAHRARQIVEQRMQAARIAGLTWLDIACAIRALGMPQANEDAVRVVRALSHVITEAGYENADECLQLLGFVAECVEELRLPPPMTPEEQRAADREHRREMEDNDRRAGY